MRLSGPGSHTLKKIFVLSALTVAITGCNSDNDDNNSTSTVPDSKTTAIHTIQQQSTASYDADGKFVPSPIEGKTYTVSGVVTAVAPELTLKDFTKEQVCNGVYFIQTADDQIEQDTKVSDGLMVCNNDLASKDPANEFKPGDAVKITGTVHEVYNETQLRISSTDNTEKLHKNWEASPKPINDDLSLQDIHKKYEGMLVKLPDEQWYVTDNYGFGRYGEIELAKGAPLWKPTNLYPAGSKEAIAEQKKNDTSRLVITDGISKQNTPEFTYYKKFSAENPIRLGNTAEDVIGVARYAYRKIKIIPTVQIEFGDGISPRNTAPEKADGQLRVASMNVLNYFNGRYNEETAKTDYSKSDAKNGDGNYHSNRGAKTAELFERQRTKIINAIVEMDADIVGLMEIENDGFGEHSAIVDLVTGINQKLKDNGSNRQYAFVSHEGNQIGTDAITTGMLYDSQTVSLPENAASITIPLPTQHFVRTETKKGKTETTDVFKAQRPSFLQTFKSNSSSEELTLVVNHLKSKGSGCLEDEPENLVEDGQQHCSAFRVSAVKQLGDKLEQLKNEDKLSENVLLIGDFNSYAQEDPILLLTNNDQAKRELKTASKVSMDGGQSFINGGEPQTLEQTYGFTNLMSHINTDENERFYSFSYKGELGNLDHAFGSTELLKKITQVKDWHINSVEPTMLDYNTKYKPKAKLDTLYSDSAYRSSDHDPVVIDIDM